MMPCSHKNGACGESICKNGRSAEVNKTRKDVRQGQGRTGWKEVCEE